MTKSKDFKIKIDGDARTHQVGVNGRIFTMPVGSEITVDEGVVDALRNSGASFSVLGEDDGAANAVSVVREDPPLTGGPKVVDGGDTADGPIDEFRAGKVDAKVELGDGSSAEGGVTTNSVAGGEGRSDYSHDTGGPSAPIPGSRDTIATSAQPTDTAAPKKKAAPRKRAAK